MQCRCGMLLLLALWVQCVATGGSPLTFPLDSLTLTQVSDAVENLPLLVPDIGKVDGKLLKDVGADKFLSLWSVFMPGNDIMTSDEPFTLLIPMNSGLPRDASFLQDKEYTRDILLNHVILGEVIDVKSAAIEELPAPYYSLAHSEIVFSKIAGDLYANDVRLTGEEFILEYATIYVIEKSIPLDQPEFLDFIPDFEGDLAAQGLKEDFFNFVEENAPLRDASLNPTHGGKTAPEETNSLSFSVTEESPKETTPRLTRFDKFRKRLDDKTPEANNAATASLSTSTTVTDTTTPAAVPKSTTNAFDSFFSATGVSEEPNSIANTAGEFFTEFDPSIDNTFLGSLTHDLQDDYSNGQEFLHHFTEIKLDAVFQDDENYTAIIPMDDAFYDYYPIDWGFNPFLVDNFTKDVLLNHIIQGSINVHDLENGTLIQTLGGRFITFTKDKASDRSYLNGNLVPPEGEIVLPRGRMYFMNKILFVDYDRVTMLKDEYPYLETGPLLSYPWPTSPFLSHLLKRLQEGTKTEIFAKLLLNSKISHMVSSIDQNVNRISYTAFIPSDDILSKRFPLDKIDTLDDGAINSFLLEHLFHDYLMEEELIDGVVIKSLSSTPVTIRVTPAGDMFIGDAQIVAPQQFLYNLGAIYMIDRPLVEKLPSFTKQLLVSQSHAKDVLTPKDLQIQKEEVKRTMTPEVGISVPFPANGNFQFIQNGDKKNVVPEVVYETRTEISFSKQINDGEIVSVSKDIIDEAQIGQ